MQNNDIQGRWRTRRSGFPWHLVRVAVLPVIMLVMMNQSGMLLAENANGAAAFLETYSRWYEWKLQTELTPLQRRVIEYLDKASPLIWKARFTMGYSPSSPFKRLRAIYAKRRVKRYRQQFVALNPPEEALEFHRIGNELFSEILAYHESIHRAQSKEGMEKADIEYVTKYGNAEGRLFGSFFATLRGVGLFDQLDQEIEVLTTTDRQPQKRTWGARLFIPRLREIFYGDSTLRVAPMLVLTISLWSGIVSHKKFWPMLGGVLGSIVGGALLNPLGTKLALELCIRLWVGAFTLLGGVAIGIVECGISSFGAACGGALGRRLGFRHALRVASLWFLIGGGIGAIIQGTYNAGWQDIICG